MKDAILKFIRDEQGATAIEYGLLAGLIAAAIVVGAGDLGGALNGLFEKIKGKLPALT
jgi:pilus assembly protein Flp/PilA